MNLRYKIPGFPRDWWERERTEEEMVEFVLLWKCLLFPLTFPFILYDVIVRRVSQGR